MLINLDAQGAKLTMLDCDSPQQAEDSLSRFDGGEFIIVGMDAFFIPWTPLYGLLHGPHYFMAQNAAAETLNCFDPTYHRSAEQIARRDIIDHAFDITRMERVSENPAHTQASLSVAREAREILHGHPDLRRKLLADIAGCSQGNENHAEMLARYVDTMISNRYLYRYYLQNRTSGLDADYLFPDRDFFAGWAAVKNGLYRVSVSSGNRTVLADVRTQLGALLDWETALAERIISDISSYCDAPSL